MVYIELPADAGERLPCFVEFNSYLDVVGSEDSSAATTTLDAVALEMAGHRGAVDLEGRS